MSDKQNKDPKEFLLGLMNKQKVEETKPKQQIEVVDEDDQTLPTTKADCPECSCEVAYWWLVQTRAGDEPETKFLKCVECKHTWREYD